MRDAVRQAHPFETLGDQIHFIKVISPTVFLYLAAERASTNIAIVRNVVNKHAKVIT